MDKLTFSTFWKYYADYSRPLRNRDELDVFIDVFDVYFRGNVNLLEPTRLSAIKAGNEQLPKNLVATYCPGRKHFEELKISVKENLMPYIPDWFALAETLYLVILNDPAIHRPEWDDILNGYPLTGEDEIATWLTNVLLCAITPKGHPDTRKGLQPVSINYIPASCKWFVGRENELHDLDEIIKTHKKVFLHGIPGIGKSELAKKYVAEHGGSYKAILWIPCRESLRQSIAEIELARDRPEDHEQIRFANHLHMLKHMTERDLLVLDNCNWLPEDEPLLDQIMECNCHMLVTTRTYVEERINLEVKEMELPELLEMMKAFCGKRGYPEQDLKLLIERLYRHTFAVELAARLTAKKMPTPRMLLTKLMWRRFARGFYDKAFSHQKDNMTSKASFYQTMSDIFALLQLDPGKRELMCNMTLMPECGVYREDLLMLLGLSDDEQVENLERMGLLRWDDEEEVVQMMPMVRETTLEDLPPSVKRCNILIDIIANQCADYGTDDTHWRLLYEITEQIIAEADIDDVEKYWILLCNTYNYMEHIGQRTAMFRIFAAIEGVAEKYSLSAHSHAEYLDMKVCLEEDQNKKLAMEEQALNLLEEAGEGDSELARNILSNLAGAYRRVGDYESAIVLLETRLAQIIMEEQTPLRYNCLTCVCNLAVTYAEVGESLKAQNLLVPVERQLQKLQENLGSEYAMIQETLGHIYAISRQLSQAKKAYKAAIAIWVALYGEQTSLVLEKVGEYQKMIRLSEQRTDSSEIVHEGYRHLIGC